MSLFDIDFSGEDRNADYAAGEPLLAKTLFSG
jgi:hypothetical protein